MSCIGLKNVQNTRVDVDLTQYSSVELWLGVLESYDMASMISLVNSYSYGNMGIKEISMQSKCSNCGATSMVQAGVCSVCTNCGTTSGCS